MSCVALQSVFSVYRPWSQVGTYGCTYLVNSNGQKPTHSHDGEFTPLGTRASLTSLRSRTPFPTGTQLVASGSLFYSDMLPFTTRTIMGVRHRTKHALRGVAVGVARWRRALARPSWNSTRTMSMTYSYMYILRYMHVSSNSRFTWAWLRVAVVKPYAHQPRRLPRKERSGVSGEPGPRLSRV